MFALLHTPSAIRAWWGARTAIVLPEEGGYWTATWGESDEDPDYITGARLTTFDPPRRLTMSDYRYISKDGPLPFEAEFDTTFEVEPHPDGYQHITFIGLNIGSIISVHSQVANV